MKYLLMIYTDERADAQRSQAAQEQEISAYFAFSREAKEKGVYVAGNALHPTDTATIVRVRDGNTLTIDGPFAETKEQLGGYYLLDCKDLDDAIRWAAKIPSARHGCIEVRPVMGFSQSASA
jgi:hypothetical protein